MNIPKIDIIVPVYKVEPYLRKCVDSLLNQTYDDYIISLVDDGSPDECPAICDEYAINYPEKIRCEELCGRKIKIRVCDFCGFR